jgi:hypothetical protein
MTMSDGGKGSTQRPRSIADVEWANRWNSIFGRDNVDIYKQEQEKKEKEEKDGLDLRSGDIS